MAFCKICACGEKIVFERRLSFPDYCPSCGRRLVDYLTYSEDDPIVEELLKRNSSQETKEPEGKIQAQETAPTKKRYFFKLPNGLEIAIPEQGGIIGRTEIGAEELADYPTVSRQHIRVMIRRNVGVLIEDISKYGTLVEGIRLEKNTPTRIAEGSQVTLCDLETQLVCREEREL